jgi:hypothetical protein
VKRGRFTEEQIIAVLRDHEAGSKTGDLVRKHSISATLYSWKASQIAVALGRKSSTASVHLFKIKKSGVQRSDPHGAEG